MVDKPIIFIRIPKTSSSTVCRNIIHKNQKDSLVPIYDGHYPYGIHKYFGIEEVSYFTFLRNPIERWISAFCQNYGRKSQMSKLFKKVGNNPVVFLERCLLEERHCNIITKQISGCEKVKDVYVAGRTGGNGEPYYQFYNPSYCTGLRKYDVSEMEEMVQKAIDNLNNHFDFVGFSENSAIDYPRLCDYYGWKYYEINNRYQVTDKNKKNEVKKILNIRDKRVEELLHEINKYDIKVYEEYAHRKNNS